MIPTLKLTCDSLLNLKFCKKKKNRKHNNNVCRVNCKKTWDGTINAGKQEIKQNRIIK